MVKSNFDKGALIAVVIAVIAVVAIVAATYNTSDVSGAALISWTCKESDGGKNYAVKGNIYRCSGNNCIFPMDDFCANASTLNEYYCTNTKANTNNIASIKYDCPQGCLSGACTGMR